MFEKEIINVDKTHRILVTREQRDVSIDPFIVFTPQRKGLLFWHSDDIEFWTFLPKI